MAHDDWVARLTGDDQGFALTELRQLLDPKLRGSFPAPPGGRDAFIEDVLQESLMRVLASLDQFEGRSKFTTWAMSIAIRCGFTELRRRRWKDVSLEQVLESGSDCQLTADANPGPAVVLEKQSLVDDLYTVINKTLTPKQRQALLLEIKGMPQEEIGRRTGSNRNAIYKLTHDARKRAKKGLEALGYSRSDLDAVGGRS